MNDIDNASPRPDPDSQYDLIVIGGGIYGILITLESSLRGLKPLLIERSTLGDATTANWLRILHGGLRYLQTADIVRFFESVRERRWFMRHFPEYIEPLKCIMPLYREFSHPPWLMRAGLLANDVLSLHRNRGLTGNCRIAAGRVLNADKVLESLSFVPASGLRAGASWTDAIVTRPEELIQALSEWCIAAGATIVEHTAVTGVLRSGGRVTGVETEDSGNGRAGTSSAPVVVNAAGHWAPPLARQFGASTPQPPYVSWAWNVLFDVAMPGNAAAAVSAPRAGAQNLFAVPWRGKALVGTGHACIPDDGSEDSLPQHLLDEFVSDAAAAMPGLRITESSIEKVYLGWMPVERCEPLRHASRAVIAEHSSEALAGLYTVWGVKYTTARDVASQVIDKAFPLLRNQKVQYDRLRSTSGR